MDKMEDRIDKRMDTRLKEFSRSIYVQTISIAIVAAGAAAVFSQVFLSSE